MKISITCAANGNNKQPLLFQTIRREHARGRDQSLEWSFRLKGLCKAGVREVYFPPKPSMQKGKQGFDCFQANQAVLMTLLPFPVHPLVCFAHIGECSLRWTLCLGEHAPPAWPKSTSSIKHGRKKKIKTAREGQNIHSDGLSMLLVGTVVVPPALGKKLPLAVSLGSIRKIIKTFSF